MRDSVLYDQAIKQRFANRHHPLICHNLRPFPFLLALSGHGDLLFCDIAAFDVLGFSYNPQNPHFFPQRSDVPGMNDMKNIWMK